MKRRDLLTHLMAHDCVLLPEGGSLSNHLAVKICRDLGIAEPKKS